MNIEVHHIVPEAQGGDNSLENGIPLCFDCHADVEHYNPKHPKGTKYSKFELLQHKKGWFKKLEETGPIKPRAELEIDRRIALQVHQLMTVNNSYLFLMECSLWNPFDGAFVTPLYSLDDRFRLPDFQFLDSDLEMSRATFGAKLREALHQISILTGPGHIDGWLYIGDLSERMAAEQDENCRMKIEIADTLCGESAEAYRTLFHLMREKLGLDLLFVV